MIRTAVYARISDDRSGEAQGVARQLADCQALAKTKGWTVTAKFVDNDLSAYSGKERPEFRAMLDAIEEREFDAVIAYHQDRLTRRPREFEDFLSACESSGVKQFATVSGDTDIGQGDGIMVARIMAAVAANQSDSASRRIRRKNDERAAAGLPHKTGERAYGYELDRMTIVESEATTIRECAARFLAGESLVSVAAWLQASGIRTATGQNEWRTPTLRNLLKSPRVAGLREHRGEIVGEAAWPAILTRAQHEQITARFKESAATNRRTPRRYLLSGKVYCGLCGTKMVSSPDAGRRRYGCRKGPDFGGCAKIFINAEPLEDWIVRAVLTRLDSPATAAAMRAVSDSSAESTTLTNELDALNVQMDELRTAMTDRLIPMKEWIKARGPIEERIEATRKRLARLNSGNALAQYAGRGSDLFEAWDSADMTLQRQAAVIGTLIDRVVIHPAAAPSNRMDPTRRARASRAPRLRPHPRARSRRPGRPYASVSPSSLGVMLAAAAHGRPSPRRKERGARSLCDHPPSPPPPPPTSRLQQRLNHTKSVDIGDLDGNPLRLTRSAEPCQKFWIGIAESQSHWNHLAGGPCQFSVCAEDQTREGSTPPMASTARSRTSSSVDPANRKASGWKPCPTS
jgi:site-specific DNA recombinase